MAGRPRILVRGWPRSRTALPGSWKKASRGLSPGRSGGTRSFVISKSSAKPHKQFLIDLYDST